jgi:hypothetical protein
MIRPGLLNSMVSYLNSPSGATSRSGETITDEQMADVAKYARLGSTS